MPLTVRKFAHRLNMGKCCHHDSDFIFFFQIGFNLAGNQQRQEISVDFNYEQNRIIPLGVTCP